MWLLLAWFANRHGLGLAGPRAPAAVQVHLGRQVHCSILQAILLLNPGALACKFPPSLVQLQIRGQNNICNKLAVLSAGTFFP